jgi:hypothetical protein
MNETSQLPLRLTRKPSPWVVVLMRLAFAILWNGFFSVFVVLMWPHRAETPIFIQGVLGFFLLLGVGIIWDVVVRFHRTLTGKTAIVEVDCQPLHPGDTVRVRVCQRGLSSLSHLQVSIAASNTVTEQSGNTTTTTTKPCYRKEIAVCDPAAAAGDSYDETFAVQIPSESFRGTVAWSIVVRQDLAQGGIDFQTFPLPVDASAAQRQTRLS